MTKQDWLNCVGHGWHRLIEPLIDRCEEEGVQIFQIKEKFGTLRFYTDSNHSASLATAITHAECVSEATCENCGNQGQIRGGSWLKCLCDHCAGKKNVEASNKPGS